MIAGVERKVKAMLSKDGYTSLSEIIEFEEFKEIADKIILKFSKQNKDYFGVDEDVSLQVICKNIQRLDVKIFEFNTLTYYKKNLKKFDPEIDLGGLMASNSQEYEWDY